MLGTLFKKVNKTNRRHVPPEETSGVQRSRLRIAAMAVTGSVLCALLVWGGIKLEDPRTLPITSIGIQGEFHHLEKQQLQQALHGRLVGGRSCASCDVHGSASVAGGRMPGATAHGTCTSLCGGFFNVDVDAIRDVLLDIPWVNAATVRRVWPDTLQIEVVEQLPVARWSAGGLVNSQGQLFFPLPETYPSDLPELQGPVDSQAVVAMRYREMEKELEPLTLHINRMVLDERRSWKIELNSGVTLLLGRVNDNARLARFARLYPVALAARAADIEQVDLRYTNGFSVRWKT